MRSQWKITKRGKGKSTPWVPKKLGLKVSPLAGWWPQKDHLCTAWLYRPCWLFCFPHERDFWWRTLHNLHTRSQVRSREEEKLTFLWMGRWLGSPNLQTLHSWVTALLEALLSTQCSTQELEMLPLLQFSTYWSVLEGWIYIDRILSSIKGILDRTPRRKWGLRSSSPTTQRKDKVGKTQVPRAPKCCE